VTRREQCNSVAVYAAYCSWDQVTASLKSWEMLWKKVAMAQNTLSRGETGGRGISQWLF